MDALGTVVLVGAAYLLLWAVSSYLIRRVTDDESEDSGIRTATRSGSDSSRYRPDENRTGGDSALVVCPACGAENDPDYTFCRHCVADLSVRGHRGATDRAH